jgi:hypothetical protein
MRFVVEMSLFCAALALVARKQTSRDTTAEGRYRLSSLFPRTERTAEVQH